jgi:hypothetical protein
VTDDVCRAGHSLAENLVRYPSGPKRCRMCERDRARQRREVFRDRIREQNRESQARTRLEIDRSPRARLDYPNRDRKYHLKRVYGMTEADFERMLAEQEHRCATCSVELTIDHRKPNTAHIDHCHETGRVRGILCMRCNSAVGYLRDDPALALKVAAYLQNLGQGGG